MGRANPPERAWNGRREGYFRSAAEGRLRMPPNRPTGNRRMNISRMGRTLAFVLGASLLGGASRGAEAAPAAKPPNFLFVYTDDQRWDALGTVQREQGERGRFPWLATPHLDRLAAEGIRFRNAFVTTSLCSPSRAAFLTGQYNHTNGVTDNRTPFPVGSVTYATLLKAAGYVTGYVGKMHMGNQRERPGFDYSASFVGQGKYHDCVFLVNGKETPSTGWVDDVSTDYALRFMENHKTGPFVLTVGFKTCHGPFTPPERAENRFAGEVPRPVPNLDVPAIYLDGKAAPQPPARKPGNKPGKKPEGVGKKPAAGGGKSPTALEQMRCISAVDDNVGRLLAALDRLGLAGDTVVVFTSDNGYYLGEHGLGDKRTAYDEALRIPLLVRRPGHLPAGKVVDAMVLNIDVAPTFLELAGRPVPPTMHGRSLAPLWSEAPPAGRKAFFYEYFREQGFERQPTVLAVRTETAKLITYPGRAEWTELFDLKTDPYETKNLATEPAAQALLAEMKAAFDREAKSADFRLPVGADVP